MITKITDKIYLDKAQNGARTLFDLFGYRLLDGVKGDDESYFLIDFNESPHIFYELELRDAYDLLAMYHVKCDKEFIIERINSLIYGEDGDV